MDEEAKSANACQAEQLAEIEALKRLNDSSSRLWRTNSLSAGLEEMLAATIELLGADMGHVQIVDEVSGKLRIVAQNGLDAEFLGYFREVAADDVSACARALRSCSRVIIEDVEQDPLLAPYLRFARDGGLRAIQSTPLVDRDGKPVGMISTYFRLPHRPSELDLQRLDLYVRQASDFIERCRRDEELRESEERFSKFMQHLPGLAWIKDLRGRYIFVNDAAAKAFRASPSELYGKSDEEIFPGATAAQFRHNDQCALASQTGVLIEEELESEEGVPRCSIVSKFPIRDSSGQTLIGGIAIDITERKRAEEALREADRRKDEFLALLAHELRNPLAPIHNGVQILRRSSMGSVCDHGVVIDMMERQVRHLIRLVDDLLEVSRIRRGKIELHKERSDMATVLRNAIETSKPLLEQNKHDARLTAPFETSWVYGDPVRLTQVFTNLINNASKFTPPGGRITVDASRQGQEAIIEVRDTGFGISPEVLPRVFDLFTQGGSRREGGLGVGLALARNLVEMHGGTIEARSDGPGRGSAFIVRLPLDSSPPLQRATHAAPTETIDHEKRVVVIDDDHDVANSLGMLLESLGAKVRVAYDGPSGVEFLAAFDPDIVFIDIGMPKIDGYETARRVRACSGGRKPNLVALTGWGQAEDRAKSLAAGFDAHITKPASVETLQELLRASPR